MTDETKPAPGSKGKPTRQHVRELWESLPMPGARTVAKLLADDGYDVSWRSVARWHNENWREPDQGGNRQSPQDKVVRAARKAEARKAEGKSKAVAKAEINPALEAAVTGTPMTPAELDIIEARRAELMLHSEAELDKIAAKARIVLNIVLMEQATRRANVMTLIPKETAAMIDSMTEASKIGLTGRDGQPPSGDDAKVIEGTVNRAPLAPAEPENETAAAIRKFRRVQMGDAA